MRKGNTFIRAAIVAVAITSAAAPSARAAFENVPVPPGSQQVLWVGNNWDGTATALRSSGDFAPLRTINVVPDKRQRLAEIFRDPLRAATFLAIRTAVLNHDQFVDDLYTTEDGSHLVLSRPSFGDVASIEIVTGKLAWRYQLRGLRSDHMAVSPDRARVAVSDSLANQVVILDIETGRRLGAFRTGDRPHENYFSRDGRFIYSESIGNIFTDFDAPILDWTKGKRRFTIADATTYAVLRTVDMAQRLRAFGRPDVSGTMRPYSFTPDDRQVYFQSSFHHGYSVYDIATDRIVKVVDLPTTAATPRRRERYVIDSAHHGIALSPQGDKLCVAATVSDYGAVVDTATGKPASLVPGKKPYWATVSGDGRHCVISLADENRVLFLDMDTGEEVARVPVGYHPQRVRLGVAPAAW